MEFGLRDGAIAVLKMGCTFGPKLQFGLELSPDTCPQTHVKHQEEKHHDCGAISVNESKLRL